MSPTPIILEKSTAKNVEVALAPTHNIFSSLLLLAKDEQLPGIHEWVSKTRAAMGKDVLKDHNIALIGFYYGLLPENGTLGFASYLKNLEETDPFLLRKKLLDAYASIGEKRTDQIEWEAVLKSPENYIDFLKEHFGPEYLHEEIERPAYAYIIDPPSMKEFLVGHMNRMWKSYLQPEWARVEPILLDSVRSFSNTDLTKMSREEAASFVTGQDICSMKWCERYKTAEKVIFIPNPHLGPYVHSSSMSEIFYVYFGARKSEGMGERIPELERTEIVSRLSALADDTRLHILQLAAERGEIRVQDLLEVIDLSQPSISRYLTQLTGSGYLQERREDGAKVYILNKDRIQKTLKALSAFLLGN